MDASEEITLSSLTQTFISHIVLDLLKPFCSNEEFVQIKKLDFYNLINLGLFKDSINELQLLDLDPNNPLASAVRLAKDHIDNAEDGLITDVDLEMGHRLGFFNVLKKFFNDNNLSAHFSVDDVLQLLQEIGSVWHQDLNEQITFEGLQLIPVRS
jgi:hypothetical protein